MAIVWGAYVTASGGYGMRIGIDLSFSAVTHTTKTCTATYKIYTQNSGTWDPPDDQIMEFDGNYSLPEQVPFTNVGTEATKGDIILRTTKTYTWTYTATSYGTSSLPQEADLVVDVIHTRPIYYPHCEVHVLFPIRPYAAPAPPTTIALARVSDVNNKITWVNKPTAGEPYTAVWLERYIYGYATWARIGTLGATVATYNDTGAIPNRKYAYRVQADNTVGTSAYVQSGIIYTTPDAPTASARSVVAGNQVLTWAQAIGYTEHETEVWRSTDGVWALLATVASGVTTYTDTTALTNQKVKYRFRTKTSANTPVLYSVDSAETTETTGVPTAPAAPTPTKPITGTIDPTGPIIHTWVHNPTDGSLQTFFEVQYRHVGDTVWKTSGKIASATASWTMPKNSVSKGNQIEWQVRTYGFSSTLASPWSASALWMTTPAIPLKYPMFLDVDTGRTEADSKVKLITEQTRRVATVVKTTGGTTGSVPYNILSYTLPATLARTGKRFRISGQANLIPNTDGMYTDLRVYIGVGAVTTGTQIGAAYVDHRILSRNVAGFVTCEYTFDPVTAGGENISTINIVLVGVPGGGSSYAAQATNRPGFLIIDEIIEGSSTAGGGGASLPTGGADGTVLTKQSAKDGDAAWEALPPIPPTLPSGGVTGTVLTKQTSADGDANWVAVPAELPVGGAVNQALTKKSATNGDVQWSTLSAGGIVVDQPAYGNWYRSTNQTIPHNVSTQVICDTVNYSAPVGMTMDYATGTITVQDDGLYAITAHMGFMPNAVGQRYVFVYAGAGPVGTTMGRTMGSTSSAASVYTGLVVALTRYLKAGEIIRIVAYQSSGANLDLLGDGANRNIGIEVAKIPASYSGSAVSTFGERNYNTMRRTAVAQSIASAVLTAVTWELVDVDNGIPYNSSTGEFTIPVTGSYDISAAVHFGTNATSYRTMQIFVNGTVVAIVQIGPSPSGGASPFISRVLPLVVGDLVTLRISQGTGAALALAGSLNYNWMSIAKVPAPVVNGAAASGVWGSAPIETSLYGADSLIGREIYIDSRGQLRAKPDVVELGGGIDLNTITRTGRWTQSQTADAASGTNYPVPIAGLLEVVENGINMVWQRFTAYATHGTYGGRIYTRGKYNTTWDPWVEITPNDTGWVNIGVVAGFAAAAGAPPQVRRINKVVYTRGGFAPTGITVNGTHGVGVIPAGFLPTAGFYAPVGTSSAATSAQSVIGAGASLDSIQLRVGATLSTNYFLTAYWLVD